jgi:uncharacterized membrane protein
MQTLVLLTTIIHVLAGTLALLVGLVAMFAKKGARLHNGSGIVYVWCMIIVAITALMLCGLQPFKMLRLFLTGIAVFSFYLCMTGWRSTRQKKTGPVLADQVLSYVTLAVSLAMIGFGAYLTIRNGVTFFPIVFLFFGFLTLSFARRDVAGFGRTPEKMHWFYTHITRMGGSYIATFTAFLVNNMYRMLPASAPHWVQTAGWIAPSLVGGLLIARTISGYRQKTGSRSGARPAVA